MEINIWNQLKVTVLTELSKQFWFEWPVTICIFLIQSLLQSSRTFNYEK